VYAIYAERSEDLRGEGPNDVSLVLSLGPLGLGNTLVTLTLLRALLFVRYAHLTDTLSVYALTTLRAITLTDTIAIHNQYVACITGQSLGT
jgi:hypothetical protein